MIGDRAFHDDPEAVGVLAGALMQGLARGGVARSESIFPGHGYVVADSHLEVPVDGAAWPSMRADLVPYRRLASGLDAVMPAHVVYPSVDSARPDFPALAAADPARHAAFHGVIFSDDLSMEGASVAGGIVERARPRWRRAAIWCWSATTRCPPTSCWPA